MATGKTSFTAYCDWQTTFNSLPDDKAGQLIKHLFSYVNDENPETDDLLINAVFAQIKATLKRDLVKWEAKSEKNKESARIRWNKSNANASERIKDDAKHADRVSDSDRVSDRETIVPIAFKDKHQDERDFLKDWNELRFKHLKKKTDLRMLSTDERDNFNELFKNYSREEMQEAVVGLFKQKKFPRDSTSMTSNPKHFLKFFNTYFQAYNDKNMELYGKKESV